MFCVGREESGIRTGDVRHQFLFRQSVRQRHFGDDRFLLDECRSSDRVACTTVHIEIHGKEVRPLGTRRTNRVHRLARLQKKFAEAVSLLAARFRGIRHRQLRVERMTRGAIECDLAVHAGEFRVASAIFGGESIRRERLPTVCVVYKPRSHVQRVAEFQAAIAFGSKLSQRGELRVITERSDRWC